MLSSLRVASRNAVSRDASLRIALGARYASTWSNVPQGPPVSSIPAVALQLLIN